MELKLNHLRVCMYPPADAIRAMVYTVMEPEEAAGVAALIADTGLMLCAVSGVSWNDALSPWPAAPVFGEPFGGNAEGFLRQLVEEIVPACERQAEAQGFPVPEERVLAGYSLCGLFSLWGVCRTDAFTRCASMSGSLWFDGFIEWFRQHMDGLHASSVYLSLGDREARARDPRMARVEEATLTACQLLSGIPVACTLRSEQGGHFREIPGRVARGLRWTAEQINHDH